MKSRNRNFIKTSRFGKNGIIPTHHLDASSSVSFQRYKFTVNFANITAEAQKQIDLTSKVDLLEARIFKLEKIINVLLNV